MESITLNNNEFWFELAVATGDGDDGFMLSYNRIGQMAVSTSIFRSSIVIDFTYVEATDSSVFGKVSADGRTMLTLRFGHEEEGRSDEWKVAFILDYAKMTENGVSTQTYHVRGIGLDCQMLEGRVAYSSQSEDPLKTLGAVLRAAGVDVDASECSIGSGTMSPFVSGASSSVIESVEDLLNRASSGRSVFFMPFRLSDGRYRICNVGASVHGGKDVQVRNVPSSSFFSSDNLSSFTGVDFHEGISLPLSYRSYADVVNHEFDQRSRRWTSKTVGGIPSLMNSLMVDGTAFRLPLRQQDAQKDLRFYFCERTSNDVAWIVGAMNRYVASSFDRMGTSAIGSFEAESGDLVAVSSSDEMSVRYGGLWLSCSVSHWFKKETWTTKSMMSRLLSFREG